MKPLKITFILMALAAFTSCASGYKTIQPQSIDYVSTNISDKVKLEYKYDLLDKKYEKKELKKGVKLVAISVTNNSEQDLMFGRDITLNYANGNQISLIENEKVFKTLKQHPATYLFYLLLTPLNFYTTKANSYGVQEETSSFPIGLILGPGLAGGNLIAASTANKKFKNELREYNIHGTLIKKGETRYGLIGIRTDSFEALELNVDPVSEKRIYEDPTQ